MASSGIKKLWKGISEPKNSTASVLEAISPPGLEATRPAEPIYAGALSGTIPLARAELKIGACSILERAKTSSRAPLVPCPIYIKGCFASFSIFQAC